MPNPLDVSTRAVFGGLSGLRRARIFHPHGRASTAVVSIAAGEHPLHVLAGEHDAIVRLSRGIGLPAPVPDFHGVAIKLLNAHGAGAHHDLLVVSSAAPVGARHVLLPVVERVVEPTYSSIVRFRNAGGVRFLVGATPHGDGGYVLATATPLAAWEPIGNVELRDELDDEASDRLRFSPWNTGGGIEPVGVLNLLRRGAYAGSQEARPDA